jgi:ComF family protein
MGIMQSALKLIYPDQCVACGTMVEGAHGLCSKCWRDTPFITGLRCQTCSQPLLGDSGDEAATCDDCLAVERPWTAGRAALLYEGSARRMILGLKHSDRTDLVKPAARWMVDCGGDLLSGTAVLVPIPVHWQRLLRRRYNQAAELAREIGALTGMDVDVEALVRTRRTKIQDGMTVEERRLNLSGAISAAKTLSRKDIVLVDDVMTTGATLSEAAKACHAAGANRVSVLVLARVAKSP